MFFWSNQHIGVAMIPTSVQILDTIHSTSAVLILDSFAFSHWLHWFLILLIRLILASLRTSWTQYTMHHLHRADWFSLHSYLCWHRFPLVHSSGNPVRLRRQLQMVSGVLRSDQRVPVSVLVYLGKIVVHLLIIGILRFFLGCSYLFGIDHNFYRFVTTWTVTALGSVWHLLVDS